jgi:transcription elongation factor GreA
MIKYPMTVQGARALEEEHAHLTKVVRPKLSQDIGTARELGDLKENAEYHAAREQQGMVEARIRDIEGRIQNQVIIDVTTIPHTGKVIFGTTVEIANVETDERVTYHIVGEDEADFKLGKISVGSPLARALIGKEEGDVVAVKTPSGVIEYEIVEVRRSLVDLSSRQSQLWYDRDLPGWRSSLQVGTESEGQRSSLADLTRSVEAVDVGQLLVDLRILAVDQRHFADDLHQIGLADFAQFSDGCQATFAVEDVELDLDQLVIAQRALQFGQHTFSQTIVRHHQHRFQMVTNGFVLFLLLLSERHNLTSASDLVKSGGQFTRASPGPPG